MPVIGVMRLVAAMDRVDGWPDRYARQEYICDVCGFAHASYYFRDNGQPPVPVCPLCNPEAACL